MDFQAVAIAFQRSGSQASGRSHHRPRSRRLDRDSSPRSPSVAPREVYDSVFMMELLRDQPVVRLRGLIGAAEK
jgi:hypothetical protein